MMGGIHIKTKMYAALIILCCCLFSVLLILYLQSQLEAVEANVLKLKSYDYTEDYNEEHVLKKEMSVSESYVFDLPFKVNGHKESTQFNEFIDAVSYAKENDLSRVEFTNLSESIVIWDENYKYKQSHYINDVPLIKQTPELDRGCEVTSLAMLINYHGIYADKMILAEEVAKDTTERKIINGRVHWGNPNSGFIGDIYTYDNPGLGVYHKPIYNLLQKYHIGAVDLTGCNFEDLYILIDMDFPIWVIINTTFDFLGSGSFETWITDEGEIDITYREHAVVITGYDEDYIYFNDPRNNISKARKSNFIKCWVQMGSQAVAIIDL